MNGKKYTEAGTDIDEVKRLNAASGLSYNDTLAILAQANEVKTVDEIPFKPLKESLEVDSSVYKLNEVPGSINLDRNGPH
ncbi:hypothetical protein ACTHOQ_16025 [Solibacillus silvestris]|uniref:hypothetical protein n=1 Tax=Solibacillus silvestris TaxID=76853 RepID=UPI003F813071